MTTSFFISSMGEYSGKTLMSLGLGLRFQKDGFKVGYFKPFGTLLTTVDGDTIDEDAVFIKENLNLSDPLKTISPVVLTHDLMVMALKEDVNLKEIENTVKNAYQEISKDKDILLIGGNRELIMGHHLGMSALQLVKTFDTKLLLIDTYRTEGVYYDSILFAKETLKDRLIGVVLNYIPSFNMDYIKRVITPFLDKNGVDVFGVIPEDPILKSMTVGQIVEILQGTVICCEDKLEEPVENFLVGAMDVENAMKYFRKASNKAVITGGHRADIILAALETATKCLILTGGEVPRSIILSKAEDAGVPIISTRNDTYTTIEKLERELGKVRVRDKRKIERITKFLDAHFNFEAFYEALKLKVGA